MINVLRSITLLNSRLALLLVVCFVSACSGSDGASGSACTVDQDEAGGSATIRCGDGTSAVIEADGGMGDCTVKANGDGSKTIRCGDGTMVEIADGADGADGTPGKAGAKGADGAPGADGVDGAEGTDGLTGTNGTNGRASVVVGAGLKVSISDVSLPNDRFPVVSLRLLDAKDRPLDRTGVYSPGAVSVSFVIAYLASDAGVVGQYVPYSLVDVPGATINTIAPVLASAPQAKSENNGTWTEVDAALGTYTYRFNRALPAGFDATKTHTVSAYASRTFENVAYASDPIFSFRPDGLNVTEQRAIVTTDTCNKCHDTLAVHGGSRRDTALCITCHVDGTFDPESGNSLDFKQMIHKIHRGENLPSVKGGAPYEIVGYNNTLRDYSDVVFPQAMENCTACHQGAADSGRWKTSITRAACTSCHDRTSFENVVPSGFVGHTAGPLDSDESCLGCHHEGRAHIGPYEVDVTKVHIPTDALPLRDLVANSPTYGLVLSDAPVLTGSIGQVTNLATGEYPKITFTVSVNAQPYDILAGGKALSSLRFTFAAPTTDYVGYAQYTAQASTGVTGSLAATVNPGEFIWTSTKTINEIAAASGAGTGSNPFPLSGTMAVGMEGRLAAPATKPTGVPITSVNHDMHNVVKYVALTDPQPIPRREATTVENCNTCHEDLTAHGGSRNDPEYCVLCHSAGRDTITRMPLPAVGQLARTENLRLSYMVHAIHSGENREHDFIAFSPSAPINFSDVRFPGDRRNCEHCHVAGQYQLPLASGLLPSRVSDINSTSTPRTRVNNYYTGATAAACVGCHDADATALHAATMSLISPTNPANITESCVTCHASGKQFGLDTVHARLGL